ncbi:MAG: NifU family protein [Ignavibacteria bacterium]|nr:NifU family protein [Ignavibacteria bacterium]
MNEISLRIESALSIVRPYLQVDNGDVEIVQYHEDVGVLEVRLLGTCEICPLSRMTLRAGIERILMHEVPEIQRVEQVHERNTNINITCTQ